MLCPFISKSQIVTTFAGNGLATGGLGDGGPATAAMITPPARGAFDKEGNFYFGCNANRIRKVDPTGIITTIAGTGLSGAGGYGGDGGPATLAKLNGVGGIHFDATGNIYFADVENLRVRKIDIGTGIITTVAGTGILGTAGDGGPATNAPLDDPQDICIDSHGNIYVAEYFSNRVRKINTSGIISNFAGVSGIAGYSGDGGLADTSKIGGVVALFCDRDDNIYMADNNRARIFKVNTAGVISTIAGTSTGYLYNGDNIPATMANIIPSAITEDNSGNLYIGESYNYRVRMVDAAGIIHTVAGNGIQGYSGDGGSATAAEFDFPCGIAFDSCDNMYISDNGNGRVRKVSFNPLCLPLEVTNLKEETIKIYPNPVTNELQIDNVTQQTNYYLLSILGTTIQQGVLKARSNTISLMELPIGIYLLEMIDEHGNKTVKKIIKQ